MHASASKSQPSFDAFAEQMKILSESVRSSTETSGFVRGALIETQQQMKQLIATNQQIENSQKFIASEFEKFKESLNNVQKEVHNIKQGSTKTQQDIHVLQTNNQDLATKVDQLEEELDRVNRARLAKNAIIIGLPVTENEDTKQLVHKVCESVGYICREGAISDARRLISKTQKKNVAPILVTFDCDKEKEQLFECKRKHGALEASTIDEVFAGFKAKVIIRDELTNFGKDLLQEAKGLQPTLDIKYVWPGRDGKVLIRRQDGSKVEQVGNKSQLKTLARSFFKRTLEVTEPGSSQFTSPPLKEPTPKRAHTTNK